MVHIFCDQSAAIPIKSYSPDLIVHATLDSTETTGNYKSFFQAHDKLNSIVVGPGLSPDEKLLNQAGFMVKYVLKDDSPLENAIFDADSFRFLFEIKQKLKKKRCILTPNIRELARLLQTFVTFHLTYC